MQRIDKLSFLKSIVNQNNVRKNWTRNEKSERKTSINMLNMSNLTGAQYKITQENQSLSKRGILCMKIFKL